MRSGAAVAIVAVLATAATSHAERSSRDIDGTIRRHAGELKACYQGVKASGKVVVKFTIQPDGTPIKVRVDRASTLRDQTLERCVLGVFQAMRFAKDEHPSNVSYPLLFSSV